MRKRDVIPLLVLGAVTLALYFLPSARQVAADTTPFAVARVLSTDESELTLTGLLEYGTQHLVVELPDGRRCRAENELRAQLDIDKKFAPGDRALVSLGAEPLVARDHWRLTGLAVLFAAFALLLAIFGGAVGLKALFSFVFSCLAIGRVLVPLCLNGINAALTTFLVVSLLTAVIMYLVAGATRKGLAAFLGAILGVAASLLLAQCTTRLLAVNGATMPFAQALLYSGFENLDLRDLFVGAIILASSGAVMDLAMDIAAGVAEVARHNPELPRRALFASGVRIGRAVVGTMTTTLLLAYSGGYLTLLMIFAAQGTHPVAFLNSTLVSAEVLKTLVGSLGLILVAPFSALTAAVLLKR